MEKETDIDIQDIIDENSKPLLLKRFIADGFDIMSLFLLFLLVAFLIERSPLAATYNSHVASYTAIEQEYLSSYDPQSINQLLKDNAAYQDEVFAASLHKYVLRCLEAFISELILFLIVPLTDREHLTLGKKLTGILLFDESRQALASRGQIFLRFMFIYLFYSVALYPWTGMYTFLLVPVLRVTILILNDKNKTLCDYLSATMCIEKLSYISLTRG